MTECGQGSWGRQRHEFVLVKDQPTKCQCGEHEMLLSEDGLMSIPTDVDVSFSVEGDPEWVRLA